MANAPHGGVLKVNEPSWLPPPRARVSLTAYRGFVAFSQDLVARDLPLRAKLQEESLSLPSIVLTEVS